MESSGQAEEELPSPDYHKQVVFRPTEHIQQLLGINAQGATGMIANATSERLVVGPDIVSILGSISRVNIGDNRTSKQNLAPRDYNV